MSDPIVVIGAGIGGLSAAIHLAAAGCRVTVYEKNGAVGGKMRHVAAGGFEWLTGPSVITMRHVFEDLFAAAGRRLEDYVTLVPVEPLTRYFYPNGAVLDLSREIDRTLAQIAALSERDVEGYLGYLAYVARLHRVTGPLFVYADPPTWRDLFRVPPRDALAVDVWRTLDRSVRKHVRSPHLRQLLGRFATYAGASPYEASAAFNVVAHVELNGGVWYATGGVYEIARALEKLARELGVEIHTGRAVERIAVEGGQARGIVLEGGERRAAQAIVANADVTTVYEQLLPREVVSPRRLARLVNAERSCSGFVLALGVEGIHPELAHHNIFFTSDYRREFDEIFHQGVPPGEPTIYVVITARSEPDHAPEGCENWFVLVNAPALGPRYDWETGAVTYRDLVLARLADLGFDVRGSIRMEHILTPLNIARLTGAYRGALYGTTNNGLLAALRRPHNRCPDVRGLYFAGCTTHPGGGVPMVTLSGRTAARMVNSDFGFDHSAIRNLQSAIRR
ncbi:MAG: phytoene desaturase [Anaerolineae bacterium]|nr:phytoene desaturase [Anaerolineae bacterium]